MPEMITIKRDELSHLEERARKLALDKSYLQLVIRLMNKVSAASGLDDTIDCMLHNILDVVGGTDIILYYVIDDDIYSMDVYGSKKQIDRIEDALVLRVFASREVIEFEHDFSDTRMTTPEFTKAYTWVYPLLVGPELVGVFKMENLHIGMRELYQYLPTFFSFVALVLKNEILGHTRLKQAYDRLSEANKELTREIEERERVEDELRKAKEELEERVAERTGELSKTNEMLQIELTERKQAEEALRESEEKYRTIFQNSPLGIFRSSFEGRFLDVNPATAKIIGYDSPEAVIREIYNIAEQIYVHTGDRQKIVSEQLGSADITTHYVNRFRRKDGSEFIANLYLKTIHDAEGRPIYLQGIVEDITERKRAERDIALMNFALNNVHEAALLIDENAHFNYVNEYVCRALGYSRDELLGLGVPDIDPDFPAELWQSHWDDLKTRGSLTFEGRHKAKDGRIFPVEINANYIEYDGKGYNLALVRDITGRKRAEEDLFRLNTELEERVESRTHDLEVKRTELEESQQALINIVEDLNEKTGELEQANSRLKELDRLKSLFIASMSHELRTPLNSVIGFSSVLLNEWVGAINAEQKENLAIILRSGKHLLSLINDVIDVSKIEAGKIESVPEGFNLHDLVSEAVNLVKKELEEKGLVLRVTSPSQLMFTDRRRLLQCVLNLLSNAVKFTEQGGVTVETRIVRSPGATPDAGVAEISVTDTGIGIREEDIGKMFQPFERLFSPLQSTVPGTGLGLYLTRKLAAEVLKGDILLTSEYGKGSRFTIRIPVGAP